MKAFKQHVHQNSLVAFRKKWSLSQKQVAEHMQVSRSMVALIEQGRRILPTPILLQLAQLEIKMLGIKRAGYVKPVYPGTDSVVTKCKRHCEELSVKELYCQEKAGRLKGKLEIMDALYQKTTDWMKLIQLHIKEAGDTPIVFGIWKKHEISAMRTLNNCSLSSQLLLKHTITFLEEEAELLQKKQLQIKEELAAIILSAQQTTTM